MNKHYFFSPFLLVLVSTMTVSCSIMPVIISNDPNMQELKQGETLYEQRQYDAAEKVFLDVLDGHIPIKTANTAIYDLTCTRIMQSTTLEEVSDALLLLDNWQQSPQGLISVENSQMVITAQKKIAEIIETEIKARKRENKKANKTISRQDKLIKTLQHQITELQAIDQELQEKKKPL